MKKIYFIGALLATCLTGNAQVVISQIYGAGGNTGALYNRDYIELYNKGAAAVDISGWTIQYHSATNTASNWNFNTIPAGQSIGAGKYYLIAFGNPGANGAALPTADFDSTVSPLTLSGTTGRTSLTTSATALSAGCSNTGPSIIDSVSFGSAAICFEGTGPAPVISASLAAFRKGSGTTDTNDNAADFEALTPSPRNSATLGTSENNISGLKVYPNPAKGSLFVTSDSFAVKNVEVYDVLGKMALSAKVTNAPLNVSSLTSGVYVVKVTEDGKTATRKIVIE